MILSGVSGCEEQDGQPAAGRGGGGGAAEAHTDNSGWCVEPEREPHRVLKNQQRVLRPASNREKPDDV